MRCGGRYRESEEPFNIANDRRRYIEIDAWLFLRHDELGCCV